MNIEITAIEFANEDDARKMQKFVEDLNEQITRLRSNNDILEACVRICHKMGHADANELLQQTLCFMVAKMDNDPIPEDVSEALHAELARFDLWAQKAECKGQA